ncbi:hypothetical protein [Saccharopolyspora pogona]|uniref:hypothetical protein n=1 Tax=Saccharopolyspora pogona TaxID=333966 RepID=UPI0037C91AE9
MGDLFGVSQPTVSRVYRGILPLIGEALCLHVPDLKEALRGRLVLVDGTDVPTGNRAGHEDNHSGKRLLRQAPPCRAQHPGRGRYGCRLAGTMMRIIQTHQN